KPLVRETTALEALLERAYNLHRRIALTRAYPTLPLETPAAQSLYRSAVVLLTRGARGITARAAIRLAELYQPTLVLAGRSPLPQPEEAEGTARITKTRETTAAVMDQMRPGRETVPPALVEHAHAGLVP